MSRGKPPTALHELGVAQHGGQKVSENENFCENDVSQKRAIPNCANSDFMHDAGAHADPSAHMRAASDVGPRSTPATGTYTSIPGSSMQAGVGS